MRLLCCVTLRFLTVALLSDAPSAQAPSLAVGLPATKPKRGAAKKDNDSDANADVTDTKNGQASADTAPKRGRKRTAIQAAGEYGFDVPIWSGATVSAGIAGTDYRYIYD